VVAVAVAVTVKWQQKPWESSVSQLTSQTNCRMDDHCSISFQARDFICTTIFRLVLWSIEPPVSSMVCKAARTWIWPLTCIQYLELPQNRPLHPQRVGECHSMRTQVTTISAY
jgi:hypothetical protein